LSGDISLDFANTAEWHAGPEPVERLTTYVSAVQWAQKAGILSDDDAKSLLSRARAHPAGEAQALRRVVAFREAVYHIFSAAAHGQPPASSDLDTLNSELAEGLTHLRLVASKVPEAQPGPAVGAGSAGPPQFSWAWSGLEDDLTSFLWPVARAAAALLTSPQLAKVRECAGDPCGWLFLDRSKNATRRWCDMADCGNRAKARRYRSRQKDASAGNNTGVPA